MASYQRQTPSRPPESFCPSNIRFVGEQAGAPEDELKREFVQLLKAAPTAKRAYLAKVVYNENVYSKIFSALFGGPTEYSVALCIYSSVVPDIGLQKRLGQIFNNTFKTSEHLDIFFINDTQEQELKTVCRSFYETA
jgi:hypothetical protein